MTCLFVYGLVNTHAWKDGGDDLRRHLAEAPGVEPGEPPRILEVGRLGVLLSTVQLSDFSGPKFAANLEEMDWIEPRARAHAGVISLAFSDQPVLPMRFGTLFSSEDRVNEEFAPRTEVLLKDLARVEGLEEWTVRFCVNTEALLKRMAEEAETEAPQVGQGTQYLLRRRLAQTGRPEMAARLMGKAETGHTALACLALEVSHTRTEVAGLPGGSRSILSRIYLIDQIRRAEFLAEVQRVSELLALEGFTILHSGPWPPDRAGASG